VGSGKKESGTGSLGGEEIYLNGRSLGQLFEEFRGLSIIPDIDDSWVWRDGTSTEFSVKSAYSVLRGHSEGFVKIVQLFLEY